MSDNQSTPTPGLGAALEHELKNSQDCLCVIATRLGIHNSTARKAAKEIMSFEELMEREHKARALMLERMQELLSGGVAQREACRQLGISLWFYKSVLGEVQGEKEPEAAAPVPADAVRVLSLQELGPALERKAKGRVQPGPSQGCEVTVRLGRLEAGYCSPQSAEESVAGLLGMLLRQGVL